MAAHTAVAVTHRGPGTITTRTSSFGASSGTPTATKKWPELEHKYDHTRAVLICSVIVVLTHHSIWTVSKKKPGRGVVQRTQRSGRVPQQDAAGRSLLAPPA